MGKQPRKKAETGAISPKLPRARSPNYPAINLAAALDKAMTLYSEFRHHEIPVDIACNRWGYKAESGLGQQCVAALKAFGIVNVIGRGELQKLALSENGIRVVRRGSGWEELLKTLAVKPAIYAELWNKYQKDGLPPDELLKEYLVFERPDPKFNEKRVDGFIEDFRATLALAKIDSGDIIESDPEEDDFENGDNRELFDEDGVTTATTEVPASPKMTPANPFVRGSATARGEAKGLIAGSVEPPCPDGFADLRYVLDEGPVMLQCPDNLSAASVEEFQVWLDGFMRRFRRKAETWAQRNVAGYEVYFRRPSSRDPWEISLCERVVNAKTALAEGTLLLESLSNHPILKQTFATPDDAVRQLLPLLSK